MPGRGPVPKPADQRRNHSKPRRGEWRASPGIGWQHGPIPPTPQGLTEASEVAWDVWFQAWFAAFWTPGDLPALTVTIRLFDEVARGRFVRAAELRMWLDSYGVTKKGQQDRRWAPPIEDSQLGPASTPSGRYGHLRAIPADKRPARKVAENDMEAS